MLLEANHVPARAGLASSWVAGAEPVDVRVLGRAWACSLEEAVDELDDRRDGAFADVTLWFEARTNVARLDPDLARNRLDDAVQRTFVGGRGLYYETASWGSRCIRLLLGPLLVDGQQLRQLDDGLRAELEARWVRASHRAAALRTPPDLDPYAGREGLVQLNRMPPVVPPSTSIARLTIARDGRATGTVVVRGDDGPVCAQLRGRRIYLPSLSELHPQARTDARWALLAQALGDGEVRGRAQGAPLAARPTTSGRECELTVDVPTHVAARLSRQNVEDTVRRALPARDAVRPLRYAIAGSTLTVHLRLGPGTDPDVCRDGAEHIATVLRDKTPLVVSP